MEIENNTLRVSFLTPTPRNVIGNHIFGFKSTSEQGAYLFHMSLSWALHTEISFKNVQMANSKHYFWPPIRSCALRHDTEKC